MKTSTVYTIGLTLGFIATAATADKLDNVGEMIADHLETCNPSYTRVIERIDRAGVGIPVFDTVPGYPWVRSTRFLASFVGQFDSEAAMATWLGQMRDHEGYARRIELTNLGMSEPERADLLNDLRLCAVWQSAAEVLDPAHRDDFFAAAKSSADNDPREFAAESAKPRGRRPDQVERDFTRALPSINGNDSAIEWRAVRHEGDIGIGEVLAVYPDYPRDPLGRIGMVGPAWRALAAHYAPVILAETSSPANTPSEARIGAKLKPYLDRASPTVYWQVGFTRAPDRLLVQLTYVALFTDEEGDEPVPADGLVWRVTLDPNGYPIAYDSLQMDSTDHLWFPISDYPMALKHEQSLLPQGRIDAGPAAIRIAADSRDVVRVLTEADYDPANQATYVLRPYDDLLMLSRPDGGSASLFDEHGWVRGSSETRGPRLRHLNGLSLAPREPWFFDDPGLLTKIFRLPGQLARAETSGQE